MAIEDGALLSRAAQQGDDIAGGLTLMSGPGASGRRGLSINPTKIVGCSICTAWTK